MIGVVDYGAGNIHSVTKAIEYMGVKAAIISSPHESAGLKGLVLPGVGSYGAALNVLKKKEMIEPLKAMVTAGLPFLGICLGMQLLYETSEETPGTPGLAVMDGQVKRLPGRKVPLVGWNRVDQEDRTAYYYFLHSYYVAPTTEDYTKGRTRYNGVVYPAIIQKNQIWACQFHPEKSGTAGLQFLKGWLAQCCP